MLKYNTFRPDRYLRSKFVEGRYLLASELVDVELELIDYLRKATTSLIGDVAIEDAWEVSTLSPTQLLIKPGEAWFHGLPFAMRSGKDQLVSGTVLTIGTVPAGVTVADDSTGQGKILTFTTTTTPSALYKVVVSAYEEIVTNTTPSGGDAFLKNQNIPEATGQKIRIKFQLNVVLASTQTEIPVPYAPDTGSATVANLVNQIVITPSSGQNGELLLSTPISGSAGIDGRDLELTIRNDPSVGAGIKLPSGSSDQQPFYNGKLVDTAGNTFYVNAVFNTVYLGTPSVIVRLDKEVGQPDPVLTNGSSYILMKRDIYATDDSTGAPLGKLFWPIADANWDTSDGFVHSSSVTDLRERIISEEAFEDVVNQKFNLILSGGGVIGVDVDGDTLHWDTDFKLTNPSSADQIINANSGVVLIDGGTLTYTLDLVSGGIISVGNLAVTVSGNAGPVTSFSGGPDLSQVKIGNIIQVGSDISQITAIDNVNKTVTVSPDITATGSGSIYRDSFASGTVPLKEGLYTLAVRQGTTFVFNGSGLKLSAGESNAIYDERILYPSGLVASTNISLPTNTLNAGKPQYYSAAKRNLYVIVNQQSKYQGVDWVAVDSSTIQLAYDIPNDSEVRFRIDSIPAGSLGTSGGGGTGDLQDAYDNGPTIVTNGSSPFTVGGASPKVAVFLGDIEVTGVIDPAGLELTPQSSNPLSARGIWVEDTANQLVYEDGVTSTNISQKLEDLENGTLNPIEGSFSIDKTGNVLSTLSAPKSLVEASAGETFAANTSFLVRWGIDPEIADRIYKADAQNPNSGEYLSFGIALSTFTAVAGQPVKVTFTGTHTLGSADTLFASTDIGKEVFLTDDGLGGFTLTAPTAVGRAQYRIGVVQDVDKIWVDFRQLKAIVPEPIYDERTLFPSGLVAGTDVTLPVNTRNSNAAQTYDETEGRLKVFVGQVFKFYDADTPANGDWYPGTDPTTQIQFNYDLPVDSEVHFRIENLASGVLTGGGGGGSSSLQDAYDLGTTINVTSGNPITINGPASEKLLVINGDIEVTGVIDPLALQLTPTGINPLQSGQAGIWVDGSGALMHEDGISVGVNITQAVSAIAPRVYANNTGSTIPALTPVYSPVAGEVAIADGTDPSKFRVIGVTIAAILDGDSGEIAGNGVVEGVSLSHNSYAYLGLVAGSLVDVGPTLGPYPSGFQIIRIGVVEGSRLLLQIQHAGTL